MKPYERWWDMVIGCDQCGQALIACRCPVDSSDLIGMIREFRSFETRHGQRRPAAITSNGRTLTAPRPVAGGRSRSGPLGYIAFEPVATRSAPSSYSPSSSWPSPPLASTGGDIIPLTGPFGGSHPGRPRVLVTATAIAGLACVAVGFLIFRKAPPGLTAPASLGPLSRLPDTVMSAAQTDLHDKFRAKGAPEATNALYAPPGADAPVLFIQAARSSARTDNVQGLRNDAAVFGQLFPGNKGTFAVSTPSVGGVTYTCLTAVGNTRQVTCIWQGHDAVLSGVGVGLGTDETVALTSAARAGMHLGQ